MTRAPWRRQCQVRGSAWARRSPVPGQLPPVRRAPDRKAADGLTQLKRAVVGQEHDRHSRELLADRGERHDVKSAVDVKGLEDGVGCFYDLG